MTLMIADRHLISSLRCITALHHNCLRF